MKNRKSVRWLALTVVLVLMVSLLGACGGGPSSSGSTGGGNVGGGDAANLPNAEGKYETPINITQAVMSDASQKFGEGQSYDKNVWTDLFSEELGINLSVEWSADVNSDAYATKLNTSIASRELPDIFTCFFDSYSNAQKGGLLADLTDAVETYGSPALKQIMADNPELFDACRVDGRLYALPRVTDAMEINASQLWIRQDWLDAVNMEAPKTWDELVAVARAFTFDDPDGNGVDDTFGIGMFSELYWGGLCSFDGIASAFHAFGANNWIKNADGQIVYGAIQPEMKNALAAARELFAEGLIDPEFGVKDTNKVVEDIFNNKIGMFYGENWVGYWPLGSLLENDPNAVFIPHPFVSADGEQPTVGVRWPVSQYTAVSADCENPEAAVLILNKYLELINDDSSAEIVEKYDYAGDVSAYQLCPVRMSVPGIEFRTVEAIAQAEAGDASALKSRMQHNYDMVQAYEDGDITQYGYWSQLGPVGSVSVIQQYIENDQLYLTWMRGGEPVELSGQYTTLKEMEWERFTKIITGANDLDDFEKWVEDFMANGGEELTARVNEMYG